MIHSGYNTDYRQTSFCHCSFLENAAEESAAFSLCTGAPKCKRQLKLTGAPCASRVRLRLPYSVEIIPESRYI